MYHYFSCKPARGRRLSMGSSSLLLCHWPKMHRILFVPKNGTKIRPVQNFYFCGGTPWVWHLAPRKPPASRHPRTHKTQKLTFSHPYRFFHFHRILIDDIATGPPWLATSPVVAIGRIIMKTSLRLWIIVKNWFCLLESMSLENIGGPRACVCTQSIYGPFFGTKK